MKRTSQEEWLAPALRLTSSQESTIAMRINQFPRLLLIEWRKLKLPLSGETIVVAVSGGADSTALLLAIEELKTHNKLFNDICVAHLDHGLRKSSAKDAKWVRELATKLGFQSVIGRSKVAENARAQQRQPRTSRARSALCLSRKNSEKSLRQLRSDSAHDGRSG